MSRQALTTFVAILEAGQTEVLTSASINAVFDRHAIIRERHRSEYGLIGVIPNAIKPQTVGHIIEAQ